MNIAQVIKAPVQTEKSVRGEASGKYTFVVDQDATKVDVKQAIEQLFGAKVAKVNMIHSLPKYRLGRGRKLMQKRDAARKAIVTLKKGEKLNLTKVTT